MSDLRHRTLSTNGIQMHVVEAGDAGAPLVLLCHGFPESWYSWRHQLPVLAAAGYHVVAPDMRGYGQTDKPDDVHAYTQLHHVGDMVGVLDAFDAKTATIIGHDWGAPVAWNAAVLRPDRFTAIAALSVPWSPRAPMPPTHLMKMLFGEQWFYFLYFQEPGKAERELDPAAETFLRAALETDAQNMTRHLDLAGLLAGHGRYSDADAVLREGLLVYPHSSVLRELRQSMSMLASARA